MWNLILQDAQNWYYCFINKENKQTNSVALSPQANYTDRATTEASADFCE
jgi:hypothetical protein